MGFKMHFSETAITVERQDVKTVAEFKARLNTQTRILEELKQGGRTTKELLTILEVSRASIDMAIKRLKDKKSINMLDGKWVLSSTREDFN
jgi:predicted transcriptional regulator